MSRLAAILFLLCPSFASAQAPSAAPPVTPVPAFADAARREKLAAAFDAIRSAMPESRKEIGAPGLAWGVIIDGELAASGADGVQAVAGDGDATTSSIFRIASMSKSFTALAILQLRDEGKLALDDAVARHIPEFARVVLPTADAPAITIRHLLTHSEGFPEDNPWGDRQLAISDATLGEWLSRGLPFSTTPGTAFEYSNYGFALLGRIVANVSGMPYADYMRTRILQPLGMRSSFWDAREVPPDRLARGFRRDGEGWVEETPLGHGAFGAMGGLYTSVDDLAKYVAFMLSAWPPRDDPDRGPVRRSSVREMQQGQRHVGLAAFRQAPDGPLIARASAYAYGLGSFQECRFRFAVSHGGGLPGYGSNMLWLPEHGVGVIVLANVTYAGAGGIARSMLEKLAATGALQARVVPASAPLIATRRAVTALLNEWRDGALEAIAADNLLLDRPLDVRRAEMRRLHEVLGACRPDGDVDAENWLRGRFRLSCDRGWATVTFTLAPTSPPRVQHLSFAEGQPLSAALAGTVRAVAAAMATPSPDLSRLAGPALDRPAAERQLAALAADYGACNVGETVSGNGTTRARVRLQCARGRTDLSIQTADDGRIQRLQFSPAPQEGCVP
jgi:CubicO group peptidase (beta-lactamase class C family)